MLQDESSIGWDPVSLPPAPSTAFKIYMLLSLVAILVTIVRLISLWIAAPPFRLSRQANNPAYLQHLQTTRTQTWQWMGCTLLGWAFVMSTDLYQACNRMLVAKASGRVLLLLAVRNSLLGPEMASFVTLFLFLVQWHLLNRMERLRQWSGGRANA